jgi:hypothetical protein
MFVGFGGSFTADEVAVVRAALPERYADYRGKPTTRRYLAFSNGVSFAMTTAIETSARVIALCGGALLPDTPAVAVRIGRWSMPAGPTRFARAQTHS